MQGELIGNPLATGIYFVLGFSLFGNESLFEFLKSRSHYYFLVGVVGFSMLMFFEFNNKALDIYALAGIVSGKEYWELIFNSFPVLLKTVCAIAFSYSFIGIAENKFSSYNSKLRFVSDGSYWIYLIHLPVVSFLTFSMFTIPLWIELKFLISIFVSTIFGLFTYKYLVRSTVVGVLLNGKRIPFNRSNWFN
jgi:glucan biosynthesis protein C